MEKEALKENTRRAELKYRMPGITNMMLTKSLRELEEACLVSHHQYDSVPPKVEYSLTDTGKDLLPTLNKLYKFGQEQMKKRDETVAEQVVMIDDYGIFSSHQLLV